MTKVFISYFRKDKAFAEKLNTTLQNIGLDSWIDWIDIPPTADWWDQIQKGIESADAFLFLLSPDSIDSDVCRQEIDHAVQNGKRMIPLVARDVNPKDVHPALTRLNWIFFREQDHFETSLRSCVGNRYWEASCPHDPRLPCGRGCLQPGWEVMTEPSVSGCGRQKI